MQLNVHDYRDLLNYDTYTKKFLSYRERLKLHEAIRNTLNRIDFELPPRLNKKIRNVRQIMKETNWKKDTTRITVL